MNIANLSQWQFAITAVYHFFFVPLTLGLSILVAIMETIYVRTGQEIYRSMTKFWGKLFLINFAMGVVTGIVMEFQFGMNWSEYARYVGDIFGAPLAIEALLAFFLESVFLGVWIFGWDRIPKALHAVSIWLVAFGTNISALWILAANSFMQQPVGYAVEGDRLVMTNFWSLLSNPHLWVQFPHTVLSGLCTASFFILGISAFHLFRKQNIQFFTRSFSIGSIAGVIAVLLVILAGHAQAQEMVRTQPMKMAAAEALMETSDPASLSLFTVINEKTGETTVDLRVPNMLSLLAYNRLTGEVRGVNDLQAEYENLYGAGDYSPSIFINYWSFRLMVGAGFLMFALAAASLFIIMRRIAWEKIPLFRFFPLVIALPYLSNTTGWLLTEIGRQPWTVFGLLKTADSVSPTLSAGMVLTTVVVFTLLYGILMAADVYLLAKFARRGPQFETLETPLEEQPTFAFGKE